jgi:chromosomal replication initiator protein
MVPSETSPSSGLWESILVSVERKIGPRATRTWLGPGKIKGLETGVLRLAVPNEFFVEWLSEHYARALNESASDALGRPVRVELSVDGLLGAGSKSSETGGNGGAEGGNGSGASGGQNRPVESTECCIPRQSQASCTGLNPNYTFDSFVVAGSNQLATAACMAVAERPGAAYNPLFVYGGSGLGKTHMLHAIGHATTDGGKLDGVCYLSAERFMNEMIASIQQGTALAFRNKYRHARVLLIDDVHFLGGKEGTQEEFFHTFNSLYEAGRQIVLTSDRPPKEIPRVEDRLISRFTWGLVADIQKPDLETRVAILEKKAARQGFALAPDVALAVAKMANGNIRELEGSLLRVKAHAELTRQPLTPDVATELLCDIFRAPIRIPTVEDVQQLVAKHFGMRPQDLCGRKRTNCVAFPRQVAMYLCRVLLDVPLAQVGAKFGGRDHTTVLYACSKIEAQLKIDPSLRRTLASLTGRLPGGGDNVFIN